MTTRGHDSLTIWQVPERLIDSASHARHSLSFYALIRVFFLGFSGEFLNRGMMLVIGRRLPPYQAMCETYHDRNG